MSRKEGEEKGETGQGRKCTLATHFSKCMPQTRAAAPVPGLPPTKPSHQWLTRAACLGVVVPLGCTPGCTGGAELEHK